MPTAEATSAASRSRLGVCAAIVYMTMSAPYQIGCCGPLSPTTE
jgi:hypothetical protein